VLEAWRCRWEAQRKDFRASGLPPAEYHRQRMARFRTSIACMDLHGGSHCPGWLAEAGLTDLKVSVKAESVRYPGAPGMELHPYFDLLPAGAPASPIEEDLALSVEEMIAGGLLDRSTLDLAREKMAAWYCHPHAFFYNALVFAAGRKA
jgi:hypothetical protein